MYIAPAMSDTRVIQSQDGLAGIEAYTRGDHARAAVLFRQALDTATDPAERLALLIHLSNARDAEGAFTDALDALRLALEIDDGDTAVWNNIGVICLKIGRLAEAREALERAVSLNPSNVAALVSLGSVALKLSDPGNAKAALERALDLAPGHPAAHANMAITLALFGRIEEAEEELRIAALYGFADAEALQSRFDRLKEIRAAIIARRDEEREDETDTDGGTMAGEDAAA